ncbi:MAG: ABC transporter ATP-binding protein [Planctomycetales bacterium]
MNSFARILPFLWPSRRKLLLSFFFAGLVALLWGGNLSIAFPVVKVLVEGENAETFVTRQIEECSATIESSQKRLAEFDERMTSADEKESLSLLRKKARADAEMTRASTRLAIYRWADVYLVPLVPTDRFNTFALIMVVLLALTLLKLICMFAEEVLVGSVVQLTVLRIRQECLRRTLALDLQTVRMQGTSELMSRFTYDIEALGSGLALIGGKLVREPLKAIACLSLAFWVNWQLTTLSILCVPLAALVFHRLGRMLKKASHKSMESVARIYKVLEETFESIKVVIAFDGGLRQRQQHHRESKNYYHKSMKIVMADALTNPATELLAMSAVVIAMLPGAYLVLRETTSLWDIPLTSETMGFAELSMMYALLAGVLDPVRKLSSVFSKLKRAGAAADRVFELIDRKTLVREAEAPRPLPAPIKSIDFQEVGFTYLTKGNARPIVLSDVSLRIARGEVVAIVGENGSGKSTLVNLLPRFFDPDRGAVLIDGIDLREAGLSDLRSRIGVVTQETLLFDESIFENIRYGNLGASREAVERAAEQAHVTPFLEQMPERFQTRVGEKGASLSGGQRQRIALARAILRDPSILILDEATSAIDSQSERLIHAALESFVQGRTTFIITHSITPSILKLVTRIVVLERGRVIADGPHAQVLESCPAYRRLYHAQEEGQSSGENDAGGSKHSPEASADPRGVRFPDSSIPQNDETSRGGRRDVA